MTSPMPYVCCQDLGECGRQISDCEPCASSELATKPEPAVILASHTLIRPTLNCHQITVIIQVESFNKFQLISEKFM